MRRGMTPHQIAPNRGDGTRIARLLGISRAAFWHWRRVPAERVIDVERVTGIPREDLRPDLYPQKNGGGR